MKIPSDLFLACIGPYLESIDWKHVALTNIYHKNLIIIFTPTKRAFCVKWKNILVCIGGDEKYGGCFCIYDVVANKKIDLSKSIILPLKVDKIIANYWAFVAIIQNSKKIISWGNSRSGGDSQNVQKLLKKRGEKIQDIYCTRFAFAVLTMCGNVFSWGNIKYGGNEFIISSDCDFYIRTIKCTNYSFAALTNTKNVITWGSPISGGNSSSIQNFIKCNVKTIVASAYGFSVLTFDGKVYHWGNEENKFHGISNFKKIEPILEKHKIVQITSTWRRFTVTTNKGKKISW